ncbi:hypothetical protein DRF58_11555 [Epilithonimonas hispanica]|uniref:Uncharacterized protein n=1 Tax=Epilithonimonas hispanica TaxID=358687 RepID=A0A3D9CW15_9FLAO|nr:hypothetical protein DRF58_11555 [Epilithonimonas hispanica]
MKNYVSNLNYFLKISSKFKPEEIMQKQLEDFIIWLVDKKKVGSLIKKLLWQLLSNGKWYRY